jgi:8-amino-7-oxononanoate synthase
MKMVLSLERLLQFLLLMMHDDLLQSKLNGRVADLSLRKLQTSEGLIDFCSNDYLGFSKSQEILQQVLSMNIAASGRLIGSGGSRLICGNNELIETIEENVASFVNASSALLFNSGYSANIGFFSCVPQRGDVVFYDEFVHASIRDGIKLGLSKSYSFQHNNIADLIRRYELLACDQTVFVVVESIYSMDGDMPDLLEIAQFCKEKNIRLVVDEAHSFGWLGEGRGLVSKLGLEDITYARIITFGKALGCHGAVVVGDELLRSYLVNFARSFIYTTAPSIMDQKCVYVALEKLVSIDFKSLKINSLIDLFKSLIKESDLNVIPSRNLIQSVLIPTNRLALSTEQRLRKNGIWAKAILSPTVPIGKERIRICLHEFNTEDEVKKLIDCLSNV